MLSKILTLTSIVTSGVMDGEIGNRKWIVADNGRTIISVQGARKKTLIKKILKLLIDITNKIIKKM